jgi:hypothetical protein
MSLEREREREAERDLGAERGQRAAGKRMRQTPDIAGQAAQLR